MGELVPHESRSVLLDSERDDLAELEGVIERGLPVFFEVGNALMEIRDRRLYRETHKTFDEYCRDRWGFSDSRARQLIAGAKTVTAVTLLGLPAPTTEREARAWAKAIREMQALDPVVNPELAVHAVRDVLRREEDRENERAKRQRETGQLGLFGVGDQAALESGAKVKPPAPAVYPGLPKAYTCPKCKYDWGRSTRPQYQLVVVSESAEGEQRERDLAFAQTTIIGRIDLLADELRELNVRQALDQETLDDIWVALGHLRAHMTQTTDWFRRIVREESDHDGDNDESSST